MSKREARKPSSDPAQMPAPAPPPLKPLAPMQRVQRISDVALRNAAPIIGVLFLQYDASRLLLVYLFDTWVGLMMVAALQALLTQRSSNDGAGNRRGAIANYFDALGSSFIVISLLMVPVLAPALLVVTHEEGRALLRSDSTLWPLLAANSAAAIVSFFVQSTTMPTALDSERRLKHRFLLGFFRWLAVVALFYVAGSWLDFSGGDKVLAVLSVLLYCGFSIYAEFYPEQIDRIPDFLNNRKGRRSAKPGRN